MKKVLFLQTARKGSKSVPNKNITNVHGRKLFTHSIEKVLKKNHFKNYQVDIAITTDCETIKKEYKEKDVLLIDRPDKLSGDDSSHHDVMIHGLKECERINDKIYDYVVILLGNSLGSNRNIIFNAINKVEKENYTGAFSVSKYNMFNPYRSFCIKDEELENLVNVPDFTNDKNCLGDVYFFNGSFFIAKRNVLLNKKGKNPFPWVGNKILPVIEKDPKMEVDDHWQLEHIQNYNKFVWPKYISREQKTNIESIELTSTQWSGYKNVEFNLKIWDTFFKFLENYVDENNLDNNIEILDYGTGSSWSSVVAKERGFNNFAGLDIDMEKPNLEFSKFHKIIGFKPHLWNGKVMPFQENRFDIIVSKAAITKLRNSNWDSFFEEMTRVSKNSAVWFISPTYMLKSIPKDKKYIDLINSKNITIVSWDWDRSDNRNDIFQPERVDDA